MEVAMTKQIFLSFLILSNFTLNAQWIQQNSGTDSTLNSVYFIDHENGWVVGTGGVILFTSDGGQTWDQQNSGTDLILESVFFVDPDLGWIAGGSYSYGIILRTQNGGNNWDTVYIDSGHFFRDVFFSDSYNGWVTGVETPVLHSNDGGENWEVQNGFSGSSIHFTDSINGWNVGGGIGGSTGYPYGSIRYTIDGGNVWTVQVSGNASTEFGVLNSVFFTDPINGWAVGGNPGGWPPGLFATILRTTDGGDNWEMISSPTEVFLTEVYFTDPLNGWAVGGMNFYDTNVILYTTNGGENWNHQFCETNNKLTSVFFVDQDNGWIVGDSGTILNTDNGGIVQIPDLQLSNYKACNLFCFPNPFSNEISITWIQTESAYTKIEIFNSVGIKVKDLIGGILPAGKQELHWVSSNLPPGIYYIRLETNNKVLAEKIVKQ